MTTNELQKLLAISTLAAEDGWTTVFLRNRIEMFLRYNTVFVEVKNDGYYVTTTFCDTKKSAKPNGTTAQSTESCLCYDWCESNGDIHVWTAFEIVNFLHKVAMPLIMSYNEIGVALRNYVDGVKSDLVVRLRKIPQVEELLPSLNDSIENAIKEGVDTNITYCDYTLEVERILNEMS